MKAKIKPSLSQGRVKIPPSKSMAHRAIICASLCDGESVVSNIDYSDDINATIECMRSLGADIQCGSDFVRVRGIKDFGQADIGCVHCGESGSTLRFLIPLFSLTGQKITFTGDGRLLKRPQDVYRQIFKNQGLLFDHTDDRIVTEGALRAGEYTLPGNVSSQFVSGLMFTLPLLEGDSKIHIVPPFESRGYALMTAHMLSRFGVEIRWEDDFTLCIRGGQKYTAHNETVEGDYSQLAFFAVLGAINGTVEIEGADPDSMQGDRQIIGILEDFGCSVSFENGICRVGADCLTAADIDLENCPDLGPVLCILAMFAQGTTHITNASRLRLKESDRILAMQSECAKMGCTITATDNDICITGGFSKPVTDLDGWADHRIVMACAVALSVLGGTVCGCEAVAKSYPAFFDDLAGLGIDVKIEQ